jgi:hypothetical protein
MTCRQGGTPRRCDRTKHSGPSGAGATSSGHPCSKRGRRLSPDQTRLTRCQRRSAKFTIICRRLPSDRGKLLAFGTYGGRTGPWSVMATCMSSFPVWKASFDSGTGTLTGTLNSQTALGTFLSSPPSDESDPFYAWTKDIHVQKCSILILAS